MTGALGIIAGSGDFPVILAERCAAEARPYFVVRLKGIADPALEAHPSAAIALVKLGATIRRLKQAGCDRVLFCGKVIRPPWYRIRLDWRGLTAVSSVIFNTWWHDDRLHRAITQYFAKAGLPIVGPADVWPDLLIGEGVLTAREPSDANWTDIRAAAIAAIAVGRTDRGQGAVVRNGAVVAVEDRDHTDGLLARATELPGQGGVLAKLVKPQQDRRMDLPVIGPGTIAAAAAARLDGIAIEAGGAMLVRRAETLAAADAAGLFLIGIDPSGLSA
ncbi:UDP-2,3-diacylglucosamine pyrophosphatase LpxI [Alphaproteobacteria bacterium SO-S41]|nr:UDP-2,3-diacylglucosamine pyrophosphatase LpxI [Alphaproteobacteria bacterium SO-S41]